MRTLICLALSLSILFYGCSTTANLPASQQAQQEQENQQITEIVVGTVAFIAVVTTIVVLVLHRYEKRLKALEQAAEAKLQSCVGKTKSDVYTMYGPPNSIVDDGQGQGGTILEYLNIVSYGGGDSPVFTVTYRKLFYLDKDNIVVSVKEDTQ